MFRSLRTIVMWLIALTIPVQGMAIAVMPLCPPAHHAAMSIGEAAGPELAALVDHSAHRGAPHAAGAAQHGEHVAGDAGHHVTASQAQSGQSGHDMLKCCSATCSMAAVTTAVVSKPTRLRSPAPLQPVAPFYRGVTLDGLDRPPKLILA